MAQLYLTRKWIQNQQAETLLGTTVSNSLVPTAPNLHRLNSARSRSGSLVSNHFTNYYDVEDLEMLLEAYFMQLEGTCNKILSVSIVFFKRTNNQTFYVGNNIDLSLLLPVDNFHPLIFLF